VPLQREARLPRAPEAGLVRERVRVRTRVDVAAEEGHVRQAPALRHRELRTQRAHLLRQRLKPRARQHETGKVFRRRQHLRHRCRLKHDLRRQRQSRQPVQLQPRYPYSIRRLHTLQRNLRPSRLRRQQLAPQRRTGLEPLSHLGAVLLHPGQRRLRGRQLTVRAVKRPERLPHLERDVRPLLFRQQLRRRRFPRRRTDAGPEPAARVQRLRNAHLELVAVALDGQQRKRRVQPRQREVRRRDVAPQPRVARRAAYRWQQPGLRFSTRRPRCCCLRLRSPHPRVVLQGQTHALLHAQRLPRRRHRRILRRRRHCQRHSRQQTREPCPPRRPCASHRHHLSTSRAAGTQYNYTTPVPGANDAGARTVMRCGTVAAAALHLRNLTTTAGYLRTVNPAAFARGRSSMMVKQ
jgi:hypothetical protein